MKTRYICLCLLATMGLTACNEYLNIDPTDQATEKLVWSSPEYATMNVNYFYGDIQRLGAFNGYQCGAGLPEGLTDEFKYGNMTYNVQMYIPNELSYGGTVLTPTYVDCYMGVWGTTYNDINQCNRAISNLKSSSFDADVKIQLEAELRFFRGMYYFELMKRYHQVVLYDENLDEINTNHALCSEQEGWDFIYNDLKFAGENLPVSTSATGRLTSGAAYALMSRAMLYCENWTAVKDACEKVFTMGYQLTGKYADAFTSGNSEAILQYTYNRSEGITHDFDGYYAPGGDTGNTIGGGFGTPTQDMVEEYEYAIGGSVDWSQWHTASGTNDTPPYDELEPRFAATILYNGADWKGRTIESFAGGADGFCTWEVETNCEGRTTTGYYLRKLVDETNDFSISGSVTPCIALRLAEVYLNYAEACYQLGDADNTMTYINKVRERVSLPDVKGLTGDDLFKALRHERKVELAFEGQYYWDMRRWGLSEKVFTGIRRHGMKVEQNANGSFTYTYVNVDNQDLNYPSKLNRLPLPLSEIENNALVEQFAEWK